LPGLFGDLSLAQPSEVPQLQRLSLSFFHARRTGTLISRVTNDVEYLRNALASGVSTMGKDALTLIGALSLALYASWRLTLLALLVIPAAGLLLGRIGRSMRRRSARTQEHMGEITAILQETITGARVVRAFGTEEFEVSKFQRANQAFYRSFVRMRRIALAARPFSEFSLVLVAVAMLWFGGREIFVSHSLAPHQFVLFVTAWAATSRENQTQEPVTVPGPTVIRSEVVVAPRPCKTSEEWLARYGPGDPAWPRGWPARPGGGRA